MVDSSLGLATAWIFSSGLVTASILVGSLPNSSRRPADAGWGRVVDDAMSAMVAVERVPNMDLRLMLTSLLLVAALSATFTWVLTGEGLNADVDADAIRVRANGAIFILL